MLRDQRAVPAALQGVIFQSMRKNRAWCAWKDDARIWLLTCEMLLELSRERGTPVLNVQLYGEDGELKDSDSWAVDREGKWRRGADQDRPATAPTVTPVSAPAELPIAAGTDSVPDFPPSPDAHEETLTGQ